MKVSGPVRVWIPGRYLAAGCRTLPHGLARRRVALGSPALLALLALPALSAWPVALVALLAEADPGIHELTWAHLVCVRPFHPFLSSSVPSFSHILPTHPTFFIALLVSVSPILGKWSTSSFPTRLRGRQGPIDRGGRGRPTPAPRPPRRASPRRPPSSPVRTKMRSPPMSSPTRVRCLLPPPPPAHADNAPGRRIPARIDPDAVSGRSCLRRARLQHGPWPVRAACRTTGYSGDN